MSGFLPSAGDRVDDIMRRWPQTIGVFIHHGMACVGCVFAGAHTLEYAAREHGVGLARLLRELRWVAAFGALDAARGVSRPERRLASGKE
jgi:hybrid cluster-associated redox disulfide protein